MLRRLSIIGAVFGLCLLLLFVQNKVLVGTQELTAELKPAGDNAWHVVFKDVAGNQVLASADDRDVVARRLKGDDNLPAVPVTEVDYQDSDHTLLIKGAAAVGTKPGTSEDDLRRRVSTKPYARANPSRDLFHITRGIDLRGGVEFICRLHNEDGKVVAATEEVLTTLRGRLDERGLTEPTVTRLSNGDVQVVIPGGTKADAARTRRVLESSGRLEFREVLPPYRTPRPDPRYPSGGTVHYISDAAIGQPNAKLIAKPNGLYIPAPNSDIYLGRGELIMAEEVGAGETPERFYRLAKPSLVGKDVKDASRTVEHGQDAVGIQFTASGGAKNEEFTRSVKGRGDAQQGTGFMAIVFDNVVKSAPHIESPSGTNCVITGRFTPDQIEDLRSTLRGGSLSVTPEVLSERVVGATLGEETIRKGLLAMVVSFFAIVAFMQFYYGRRLGTVANLCLVATTFLIWSILSVFGATVTLPGLAGLVLTIGMAVDTNILIFERIREELREQKGMKASIEAGYDRAFLTIVDAHLTTLITAFILYWIGTGPVKGFGLTLIIGILVNLFSGVFIGRMITDWLCRKVQAVGMASWVPELNLPYVEWRRVGYVLSFATGLLGLLWFAFGHVVTKRSFESNFDIDFTGGNMVQVIFNEELSPARIDEAVEKAHAADPKGLSLIDPAELRKQPYFAEFGGTSTASRQWVFRARDEEGGDLEKQHSEVYRELSLVQRRIDELRGEKPDETAARKIEREELPPLQAKLKALSEQISGRTEAFKDQLSKAFTGLVGVEGADLQAVSWKERTLTLTLATLDPVTPDTAGDITQRLRKLKSLDEVQVVPATGAKAITATITWKTAPAPREQFEPVDAVGARLHQLLATDGVTPGDANARAQLASEVYNDLVNVTAAQKVTIARPFPSSEHFSGQVADQMKWHALLAVVLSLTAILAYVASRFEFRFGIGAVLSLFHDVVLTIGLISVLGVRIDLNVIAAVLTLIGYSINDTIVTFDRIRELMRKNAGLPVPLTMPQIIDSGIAQTMPRTVLTTGTVFLTVLVLVLFGGDALHSFSLTLLIGIACGTYSSIFIAAPLLLSFKGKIADTPPPADPNAAPPTDPNAPPTTGGMLAVGAGAN